MAVQTSGSDSRQMRWPKGKYVAVCLTFDFDAKSLWLAREEKNARLLATLSQGRHGAKVGLPKILELLKHEGLTGTFFTPGWTIDNHPYKVGMILKKGHELAQHGYALYRPGPADRSRSARRRDRKSCGRGGDVRLLLRLLRSCAPARPMPHYDPKLPKCMGSIIRCKKCTTRQADTSSGGGFDQAWRAFVGRLD
jgi:hypothetical protein